MTRRVLVVGAGLSGLVAARSLVEAGHEVTVLDKGRGVGGRLATRRIGAAVLDHGAQFFTVRSDEFGAMVGDWVARGVAHEWCRGFSGDGGHPRYVGSQGMTGIAKDLARGLDVRTSHLAFSLEQNAAGWMVVTDDGARHTADAVILTAPLPQSFSLMFSAGLEMPDDLRTIDYDRTLGLLAVVDSGKHSIAPPGGMQDPDTVFSFIADNRAKGVSDMHALTFHANPSWSLEHFDLDTDDIHARLLDAAAPWIGDAKVIESQPKKWRFATPQRTWPDACWVHDTGTLVLAGDVFAGPRMEGAALSGLASAQALA